MNADFNTALQQTKNVSVIWKKADGIAPDDVTSKMDKAMLDWMVQLTECLQIWIKKGFTMTEGELILARTNLGAIVESWLKLFYCIYYDDFKKQSPYRYRGGSKRGTQIEPEDLKFSNLEDFSTGIFWDTTQDAEYQWVDRIRKTRNAIHSFNYKDIGNTYDFINDLDIFYAFVAHVYSSLPPLEDCLETMPEGYVPL